MARGGMVYVKRDMSNHEDPLTFESEAKNPLLPWCQWAIGAMRRPVDEPLPTPPALSRPKKITNHDRASARRLFMAALSQAGLRPVQWWADLAKGYEPILGSVFEGIDGSAHVSMTNSWLQAGMASSDKAESGWIEWAAAAINGVQSRSLAKLVFPPKTIVEAWEDGLQGEWMYSGALNGWWNASLSPLPAAPSTFTPKIKKALVPAVDPGMFARWTELVHAIDRCMQRMPSEMGLPWHWTVSARQCEASLQLAPSKPLPDMGPLPPVHSHVAFLKPSVITGWMGTAEWALARFCRHVQVSHAWDEAHWEKTMKVVEKDMGQRHESSLKLMTPFEQVLLHTLARLEMADDARLADIGAWALRMSTPAPRSPRPAGSPRRL